MNWDYDKGSLDKYVQSGGLNKRESQVREKIIEALNNAGLNAEKAFFGVMVYMDGKGYKLTLSED